MPATTQRVPLNTAAEINERIRRQTEANIVYYSNNRDEIDRRLEELDREWDVERVIETESAATVLLGTVLGAIVNRKWLLLPVLAATMLALHNTQGWYPLLPLLRRLGVRTQDEIEFERYRLKAHRGDFRAVAETTDLNVQSRKAFDAASH